MNTLQECRLLKHPDGTITIHWDAQTDTGGYVVSSNVAGDITVDRLFEDFAAHQRLVNAHNKIAGLRESFE